MSVAVRIRRQVTLYAMERFFHSLSAAGRIHPLSRPERHGIEVVRDVPYAEGLALDVWLPKARREGTVRAVLYVHGGAFRMLSKDTHWIMALMFARAGYVVFNVDYRLAKTHPFPAAVQDVARAYLWVTGHAAEYGLEPRSVALAGESAGGNLITGLAIAACFERPETWAQAVFERGVVPAAVLPACGLFQVTDTHRFARKWRHISTTANDQIVTIEEEYLRGASSLPRHSLDFADPLLLLERDVRSARPLPPFLVTCGTRDPLLDDSRRLHAALERRGVRSELHLYPRELHAFHAATVTPNARRFWGDTFRFLDAT